MASLLAVDLGLKTGLALFAQSGRLVWYRSQNLGKPARLRRAASGLLDELDDVAVIVMEGGGPLAEIWQYQAQRRRIEALRIGAEVWRAELLLQRQQRCGAKAKEHAGTMARRVIDWSGATRPTSLRHDAAEAILIGLWGVVHVGWLDQVPAEVRQA